MCAHDELFLDSKMIFFFSRSNMLTGSINGKGIELNFSAFFISQFGALYASINAIHIGFL